MTGVVPISVVRSAEEASFLLEPTRRRLLAELAEPLSAAELARRLELPRQRLGHHLRELERRGWIECVEERRRGNCVERRLRVTARALILAPEALGAAPAELVAAADRASAGYLVAVAARTVREVAALEARARAAGRRLPTLALDAEIAFASAAERAEFAERLTAAVADLAARYGAGEGEGRRYRLVAAVHPLAGPDPAGEERPS